MPARIGINACFLDPRRSGGAETYTRCLIAALAELPGDERFMLFAPRGHEFHLPAERFEIVECNVAPARRWRRIAWEQIRLPTILRAARVELVHFPYGTLPWSYHGPAVVTIHDTLRFHFPDEMSRGQRLYRRWMEHRIASTGQHVIGVSHTDAAVISTKLHIPPERVSVVYHGVSDTFRAARQPMQDRDAPYALWVGRPYRRKNVELLIEAYGFLKSRGVDLPRLRIVGVEDEHRTLLQHAADRSQVSHAVSLEPPIPHDRLLELVAGASLFLYPSRYESFGLPVLEALAAGVPVLCADIAPFHELFGEAVAYGDHTSASGFADAWETLHRDPARLRTLAAAGPSHALPYTWRVCAEQTLEVYRRVLSGSR